MRGIPRGSDPRPSGWIVLAVLSAWPAASAAQVLITPAGAPDGTTELSFFSEDPGLPISMLPPGESADWRIFPDSVPGNAQPLCVTPCDVRLAPGSYVLFAGGHELEVTAAGGRQGWMVEDANGWLYLGGVTVVALGITGVLFGAIFMGLAHLDDPPDPDMFLGGQVGLGLGIPLTVLGGFLWGWSYGSAVPVAPPPAGAR